MISRKLEQLENITRRQQAAGTEKLRKAEIEYDDGSIQGVMEHIPAGKSGGAIFTVAFAGAMPVISETIITDERVEI
ncbi:MAG: hypothetical protein ACI4J7_06050 [Ruminiclostridium sp.]